MKVKVRQTEKQSWEKGARRDGRMEREADEEEEEQEEEDPVKQQEFEHQIQLLSAKPKSPLENKCASNSSWFLLLLFFFS